MSGLALVLAGHGSHISPETAGTVWTLVDQLRAKGIANEVTAAFWKEAPELRHVLRTITASTVVVIPVFTSTGYFTQTVIPSEMNLTGAKTVQADRTIYLTPTLGEHPAISEIVTNRVLECLSHQGLNPQDVTVGIIGHGTSRSKRSQNVTRTQVDRLRKEKLVADVLEAFLDDDPDIPGLYARIRTQNLIALPFFLANGSHVSQDVPRALGITNGEDTAVVQNTNVYYVPPVGTHPSIIDLIIDLAETVLGTTLERHNTASVWGGFPETGKTTFVERIQAGELVLGDIQVTSTHVRGNRVTPSQKLQSPHTLRTFIREYPFRPLTTSKDLRQEWSVDVSSSDEAYSVVETVYPGLIADWASAQNGSFQPGTFKETIASQTGMYRSLQNLSDEHVQKTVHTVCADCVREPSWYRPTSKSEIPCASPCNWWLSHAKDHHS